jgi:MoCo/4Fe-4S cofactor protein with predicted Tat translocation signal
MSSMKDGTDRKAGGQVRLPMADSNPERAPRLWRSLAEYEGDPEFQRYLEHEFGTPLTDHPPNSAQRRRFMQLMGASFALAGAAGCRWEEDKMVPMSRRPEGTTPGVPRFYRTAMELDGVGVPLQVKSYDGRPIKIDGSPVHADSQGATGLYEQASVLGLYDPDRSRGPARMSNGEVSETSQEDFEKFLFKQVNELRAAGGAGLFVLTEPSSSLAIAQLKASFAVAFPNAGWFEYEPVNQDNVRAGSELAFGAALRTHVDAERADVLVTLEADPLAVGAESLIFSPGFSKARDPEGGRMNRLYAVESTLSSTGGLADHRLPLRSALVSTFAVALEAEVAKAVGQPPTQPTPDAKFLAEPKVKKFLDTLVKDLVAHKGASAVMVGPSQPAHVHALVHRINSLLGNGGRTISYTKEPGPGALRGQLAELVGKLKGADTLIILGGNPVYTASGDVDFKAALAGVKTSIHLSLYRDETSRACTWHAPLAHYLESWADSLSYGGSRLLAQPLIAPLYGAKSEIEYLALVTRDKVRDGQGLVRRALGLEEERAFRHAVHDGSLPGALAKLSAPEIKPLAPTQPPPFAMTGSEDGPIEICFAADSRIHDGRFANNGWLQEIPESITKLTWENALLVNPKTAAQLGIEDQHVTTVTVEGRSVSLPALITPGQAPGSLRLWLGFGRTEAGIVAGTAHPHEADPVDPAGANVYPLRTLAGWDVASTVEVQPQSERIRLATTQDKHPMDDMGRKGTQERLPQLVRQDTFAGFKKDPTKVKHAVHHPPLLSLWNEPIKYEGHRWGMTIDLNKCSGCNACVMACNAENNIPVVGRSQVLVGREMHWLRIDRYFQGNIPDEPEQVHMQPVLCQHCEHAPCEQVCPVAATTHSHEGLNDMAYNRCIGTRYCSNNCPYKVRRFNYFNFNLDLEEKRNETARMGKNPEVTIRFRGVMEKCSFCVQRIQNVKIQAKNERRELEDQDVRVACQEACSSQAIEYGDLNLQGSRVAEKAASPRAYGLLEELNNRPRVRYLARITNPHPDLMPAPEQGGHTEQSEASSHG